MVYIRRCLVLLLAVIGLTGCDASVGNHVVWSPDARTIAILSPDGLYLGDAEGGLSPCIADGVQQLEWLPDSTHAVCLRKHTISRWDELKRMLSPKEADDIILEAGSLRQAIMTVKKSIEEVDAEFQTHLKTQNEDLVFLFSTDEPFKTKFLELMDKTQEKAVDHALLGVVDVHVIELVALSWTSLIPSRELFRTRLAVEEIRLSGDGKNVAIVENDSGADGYAVLVASIDGMHVKKNRGRSSEISRLV